MKLFLVVLFQNFLGDLAAGAAGVHGHFFDQTMGLGLGVVLFLNQVALGTVYQAQLCDLIQQLGVFGPQHSQALVVAGGQLHGLPEYLSQELKVNVEVSPDPVNCVALGTAMSLSVRDRLETGFTDATPRIGRR